MDTVLVVAVAANGVIGSAGRLPWHLPKDMARFQRITWGHRVVMGRVTYESIGHPLPGRQTIVVTQNTAYRAAGCVVAHSLAEAVILAWEHNETRLMVAGGEAIYRLAMPMANTIYLTLVRASIRGDAFFPDLDRAWVRMSCEEHPADDRHPYSFAFYELKRQ